MSEKNKISIFARDAKIGENDSGGLFLNDTTWSEDNTCLNGNRDGIASSTVMNTALRQTSFMAKALAEIILTRANEDIEVGPATSDAAGMESKILNYASIFNTSNFLKVDEIKTKHITDLSITTSKIADEAVTGVKLGKVINKNPKEADGILIALTQDTPTGGSLNLNIQLTPERQKASLINASPDTNSKKFIVSRLSGTASYDNQYFDTNVFIENSIINASGLKTTGNILSEGNVQAINFTATSDKRLKENIKFAKIDALDILNNIDIYNFNLKGQEEKQIGIMAQDLKCKDADKLFYLVREDGYLAVKENKLVYLLWKGIQELQAQIDELKQK